MISRIFDLLNKDLKDLNIAAFTLGSFAFLSQFLGFLRDRLLAGTFGPSPTLDAYYASFRIPDILFVIVSSMVSAAVLVPLFVDKKEKSENLRKVIDSLFSFILVAVIIASSLIAIFADPILSWLMPSIRFGSQGDFLVLATRILTLSPILLCVSQLLASIVQSERRFILASLSPILYNFGLIVGILVLVPFFGPPGLIFGVVLGLLLHLLIQVPTVASWKLIPRFTFKIDFSIIKYVVNLSLPRALTLSAFQIILFYLILRASEIGEGLVTIFNFAFNLQSFPLAIIGVSYSMAAFPVLAKFFSEGRKTDFIRQVEMAARYILFWSLPTIGLFVILRSHIVRVVLGAGNFDWNDTTLTAATLALFIVSIFAQSLSSLFLRSFYASGETKKPFFVTLVSCFITIVFAESLMYLYSADEGMRIFFENLMRVYSGPDSEILMLALAFSLGSFIQTFLLWIMFEKKFGSLSDKKIKISTLKSLVASIVIMFVTYVTLNLTSNYFSPLDSIWRVFLHGLIAGSVGCFFGALVLILLRSEEFLMAFKTISQRFVSRPVIAPDQETL